MAAGQGNLFTRMNRNSISTMSDDALTAYLFGIAVACPLGLPGSDCPLVEFQRRSLGEKFDYLARLSRVQKLQLASRHFACAETLPDYLQPASTSRAVGPGNRAAQPRATPPTKVR